MKTFSGHQVCGRIQEPNLRACACWIIISFLSIIDMINYDYTKTNCSGFVHSWAQDIKHEYLFSHDSFNAAN